MIPTRSRYLFITVLFASLLACPLVCATAPPTSRDEAESRWARRAWAWAEKVENERDKFWVWRQIADHYAKCGDVASARVAAYRPTKSEHRRVCLTVVADRIAEFHGVRPALAFAKTIQNPIYRNSMFSSIASVQLSRHEFQEAEQTMNLRDDWPGGIAASWYLIVAHEQALAGCYDEALQSTRKFAAFSAASRDDVQALIQFIEKAKLAGKPRRAKSSSMSIARMAGLVPLRPQQMDLPATISRAERTTDPFRKSGIWLNIAWDYQAQGKLAECRQALQKAKSSSADRVRDRPVEFARFAALQLHLGDVLEAKQTLLEGELLSDRPIFSDANEGIPKWSAGPMIAGVLVRAGEEDAAFLQTRLCDSSEPGLMSWALGAFCALDDKLGELESRVEHFGSNANRALLAIGAADGLFERRLHHKQ